MTNEPAVRLFAKFPESRVEAETDQYPVVITDLEVSYRDRRTGRDFGSRER